VYGRRFAGGGVTFGPGFTLGPAIKGLLIANVGVYILQILTQTSDGMALHAPLVDRLAFVPSLAFGRFEIWRFFTYMFLHGGFWHIAFNMFGLWMFGSQLERVWGSRTFLIYYCIGGVGAALTYGVFSLTGAKAVSYMLGASGAVYAILLAYGVTFPNAILLMFFLFPMKAKYAVAVFALIEFLSIPGGGNIAHLAHLGGMVFGLAFLWTFGGLGRYSGRGMADLQRAWRRWRARTRVRVVRPDHRAGAAKRKRSHGGGNGSRGGDGDRIDAILDKISRDGLDSLTDEEREILRRASRKR
jgi:membrane associated rhomboid family serine protease